MDHRADIYALGVLLHEMAAGSLPGPDFTPQMSTGPYARLRTLFPRALARTPEARYSSVQELKSDVMTALRAPAIEPAASGLDAPSAKARPGRRSWRRRIALLVAAICMLLMLLVWRGGLGARPSLAPEGLPTGAPYVPLPESPLLRAAMEGRAGDLGRLLNLPGQDLNQKDSAGRSALAWAANQGHLSAVRELLRHGAEVNESDKEGGTPLTAAAFNGHASVVEALWWQGATNARTARGETALILAAHQGHLPVCRLLMKRRISNGGDFDPDIDARDADGQTALCKAAAMGHADVVELLLANGAKIDRADNDGRTPLIWAALNGHEQLVRELMTRGADANRETQRHVTVDAALGWRAAFRRDFTRAIPHLTKALEPPSGSDPANHWTRNPTSAHEWGLNVDGTIYTIPNAAVTLSIVLGACAAENTQVDRAKAAFAAALASLPAGVDSLVLYRKTSHTAAHRRTESYTMSRRSLTELAENPRQSPTLSMEYDEITERPGVSSKIHGSGGSQGIIH